MYIGLHSAYAMQAGVLAGNQPLSAAAGGVGGATRAATEEENQQTCEHPAPAALDSGPTLSAALAASACHAACGV